MTPFKMATRRNRVALNPLSFTAQSQQLSMDLPQVGYLANLWIPVYGTIATDATATPGTWDPNYWPGNLFQTVSLRTNEGLEIYRSGGYENHLVQIATRASWMPDVSPASMGYNVGTKGSRLATSQYPTSTIAASTTYYIGVIYRIPVAVDDLLSAGLLLLQNQATRLTLVMQTNTNSSLGITAGGANPTWTLTAYPSMEVFSVPADPQAQPNLDWVHRWVQDDQPWTATGDIQYKIPVNGVISRCVLNMVNNAVPQDWFSTASRPTTPNLGNLSVQYAASMKPEIEDFRTALARSRYYYGQDLPNGCLIHDFSMGQGLPEMFDARDVYDTANLTEFSLITNVAGGVSITNGRISYIREELQRRAA